MKRGAPRHPKVIDLGETLGISRYGAVGLFEGLLHCTAEYAPRGNIGKLSDPYIASECGWDKEPQLFIDALVKVRLLDRDDEHRLLVHDWAEHAERYVALKLERRGETFIGRESGLPAEPAGSPSDSLCAQDGAHNERTKHAPHARHGMSGQDLAVLGGGVSGGRRYPLSRRFMQNTLASIQNAYPASQRTKGTRTLAAIDAALCAIQDRGEPNPENWLHARVTAFAASRLGKSQWCPAACTWFEDGQYDDPPEAWERTDAPKGVTGATVASNRAKWRSS